MRAGRLLILVLILQQQGRLTAAELAERLEVTDRTVLRDIEALSSAGVPVYATRGPGGGFQLLEGYTPELTSPAQWRPRERRPGRQRHATVRISPEARRLAALLGRLQPLRVKRDVPSDSTAGAMRRSVSVPWKRPPSTCCHWDHMSRSSGHPNSATPLPTGPDAPTACIADRALNAVPLCGDLRPPRPPRYAESRVTREMISSRTTTGMRMRELTRGLVPGRARQALAHLSQ